MPASILSNTAIASGGRVINASAGLLVMALVAHGLGVQQFGGYILVFSFGVIVQLVADLGLYLTLTRELAKKNKKRQEDIIANVVSLRLMVLVVVFLLGALSTKVFEPMKELTMPFVILGIGFACQSLSQLLMGIYQHYQTVWRVTVGDLAGRAVQLAVILSVGLLHMTVVLAAVAFMLGSAVSFGVHRYLLPNKLNVLLRFSANEWRRLWRVSWPLAAMLLVNAIYFRTDVLILSLYASAKEVGWYGLAYRIIESGLFWPAMLGGLLLPRISGALADRQKQVVRQYLEDSLKLVLWAAVLLLAVLIVTADGIIDLVAGEEFAEAGLLLQVLAVALAIMYLGNIFGFALVAYQKQMALLKLYIGLAVVNVAANFIFIPRWGALAAAITTVATEAMALIFAAILVYKLVRYRISKYLVFRIWLIGLLTAGVLVVLKNWPILWQIATATVFYLAMSVVLKVITRENLGLLLGTESGK